MGIGNYYILIYRRRKTNHQFVKYEKSASNTRVLAQKSDFDSYSCTTDNDNNKQNH